MKMLVAFVRFFSLLCGFISAWWLDALGDMRFKAIARGPISQLKAINEKPVTYPGAD